MRPERGKGGIHYKKRDLNDVLEVRKGMWKFWQFPLHASG